MTFIEDTNESGSPGGGAARDDRMAARALSLGIEMPPPRPPETPSRSGP